MTERALAIGVETLPAGAPRRAGLRRVLRELPWPALVPLLAVVLVGLLAPAIAPYNPVQGVLAEKLLPPAFMPGGNPAHPLGTDALGRDTLSRFVFGARISLIVSLIAVAFSGAIGVAAGVVAGYYGRWVDVALMRLTDVALSLPLVLIAIVMAVALEPSFWNVILVISLLLWPRYARQIRGETLGIRQEDYIALSQVAGLSPLRIIWRHVLPNIMPTFLVLATLQVGYVILLESTLSFLGVGLPSPQPAWGVMVAEGRGLLASAWWLALFPGLGIFVTVLSVNSLGDWLRDRLDPKLRQV